MKTILIANSSLTNNKSGSWTNRISRFLEKYPAAFDFILSPSETPNSKFIFCKKRKPTNSLIARIIRKSPVLKSCRDYYHALNKILDKNESLHLVIVDDLALLEGMAYWKSNHFDKKIRLDFSFHGHSFVLPETWGHLVDHVYFLTYLGYKDTLRKNDVFVPQIHIVGNGTDNNLFFPLSKEEKTKKREQFGYKNEDRVAIWVSNNRPKKGLDLFLELSKRLLPIYPELNILIVGASLGNIPSDSRIKVIGKIPNYDLPKYLQLGDIYCFTSLCNEGFGLTIIEAAKSGNVVIASERGGIPEVLDGLEASFLVEYPNQLASWEKSFAKAWEFTKCYESSPDLLANFHPLGIWEEKFLQALRD